MIVVFPLKGETEPEKIQENVRKANKNGYTLYCLGFGYGVDYGFLEKMALENSGIARRIYEDSDATVQMQVSFSMELTQQFDSQNAFYTAYILGLLYFRK